MKEFLKSRMVKFCIAEVIIALIAIAAYLYYQDYQRKNRIDFEPFVVTANGLSINSLINSKVIEGTPEDDLIIASPEGSKIFAKGGLNYVIANTGPDELYYSLCSTKIIDGKVNVIEGFDPKQDKLKVFCMRDISHEAIRVVHKKFNNQPITYVAIKGKHSDTGIALLGDIDLKPQDIILNEKWTVVP